MNALQMDVMDMNANVKNRNKQRVVITGMGIVSCLGSDVSTFFSNLLKAESGIRRNGSLGNYSVGKVEFEPRLHFSRSELMILDRVSQFAVVASRQAVESAGLELTDSIREGAFYGTGFGGAATLDDSYGHYFGIRRCGRALTIPMTMVHAPVAQVAIHLGIHGEAQTYSTACSSLAVAVGEGFRRIRDGYLDVAVTGGTEAMLLDSVLGEWSKLRVLAKEVGEPSTGCRPFAKGRNGFHLSEGAATLVLESYDHARERGAKVLGEVVGYGVSNDGTHITKPDAGWQAVAIRSALEDGQVTPGEVDYINAHGTSTVTGDKSEADSIRMVFGERGRQIKVSATKSAHGHAIGATGAMELIVTVMAMNEKIIPPTPFIDEIDDACDVNLVMGNAVRMPKIRYAISNSFGFGGNNAVLLLKGKQ
ncbi:MAG: beta-ketoacyl-[acyl-carrier-protein] synthase family protein [Candidatus Thiodiazotropha sp. (ex Rostrolucina anterorostrata)]|nr:beta-ketoacyl-[acyl-carrier-protein] synthase family protein [Candidatus Thiodiazotropha sp. (ex Rostrolucina anterorostrata)]